METIKKIIQWLFSITPVWLRVAIIGVSAFLLFLLSLSACGTTRAVVHTRDSGTATITITTNNPIDVSTTPNIDVELKNPSNHESTL